MAPDRKSPQEKKQLEHSRGHFTFGWRSSRTFPKIWKQKKTHANREYRRKSDELLSAVKPGSALDELPADVDDLTAERFRKSIVRKPLAKGGTVTVGEKVRRKLEKREQTAGRRVKIRTSAHQMASTAIETLCALKGDKLAAFVRDAERLHHSHDYEERGRLQLSKDPVDQAQHWLKNLSSGDNNQEDAVCRDPELRERLEAWMTKANRILRRDRRVDEQKLEEKLTTGKRLKARQRESRQKAL